MSLGKRAVAVLLAGLLVSTLAGCASKINKNNYDKVKTGMTPDEVQSILGKENYNIDGISGVAPGSLPGQWKSLRITHWTDGTKEIAVTFVAGKVESKQESGL